MLMYYFKPAIGRYCKYKYKNINFRCIIFFFYTQESITGKPLF